MSHCVRRFWFACLRWAKLRPPLGHMEMLREELGRREDRRLARNAEVARERLAGHATAWSSDALE